MSAPALIVKAYDFLTDDEDARVCKDIPESACNDQPKNYFLHLGALALTKTGDKLVDAKIVLAWLLSAVGAPGFFLAMLVPVRETLSLLPQMIVAAAIRRAPVRKWFWCVGAAGQAVALVGIALAAVSLEGTAAGWAIIACLAAFSIARGVSSVSHKDVLGKTVSKTRRGGVSGYAEALSGLAAAGLALWLIFGGERSVGVIVFMLLAAAALWLLACFLYAFLAESPGATEGGANALDEARRQLSLLATDQPFREFVFARTALLGSALAAPYVVALAQERSDGLGGLGGALAGVSGLAAAMFAVGGAAGATPYIAALFFLYVAHAGVRTGRKTHIVDIARADTRAAYVAVSNAVIGAALIVAAGLGALAELAGPRGALIFFSLIALLGAAASWRLNEAQR